MTRALFALLFTALLVPADAAARVRAVRPAPADPAAGAIADAARQAADAAMAAGVPAVQIAVSKGGRVVYSGAFGMTDRVSASAATPQSVMQVGSITKQFTSAAILRLAERGALTLDDRIEKYVPEFKPPAGAAITLRHLLTHTSGVTSPPLDQYAPLSRAQFLKLLEGQPLAFTPGSAFSYSNTGYRLLGYAIETITGMAYADFIHQELALPLGLLATGVCGTANLPAPDGYGVIQGKWTAQKAVNMSVPFSAGALCSTASDLVRWSHLLATGRVMLPASYAAMTTPTVLANKNVIPYGLGLDLLKLLQRTTVWHGGAINGFNASLIYFPESEVAVGVIINAFPAPTGADSHAIAMTVARAALP